ncbi:transposase [Streptomyces sp. NPDC048332]|uniref:transposase n=1 Tax=Streptomyces sp. NPDC048332 TaxID=3154619 RepID=UPI0034408839
MLAVVRRYGPRVHPGRDRRPGVNLDREFYKARNVAERCFSRLKQFRAVATRFDRLAARYRAGLHLAALVLWLRETCPMIITSALHSARCRDP